MLSFAQRLAAHGKRADLAELTVTGGVGSINRALLVFNLWAGDVGADAVAVTAANQAKPMKLLRNPIVTGILALVAVVVVFYQFGGAKLFSRRPAATQAVAPAANQFRQQPAPGRPVNLRRR